MRIRLILSFILISLVSIASVVVIARQQTANEVGRFMSSSGMGGLEDLEAQLETFFRQNGSWQGVESVLENWLGSTTGNANAPGGINHMGPGMMRQRFRLADANGTILYDSGGTSVGNQITQTEMNSAIELDDVLGVFGYLLAEGGMGLNQNDQSRLLARLENAALAAGLFAGGVSLILALLLSSRLIHPISNLTRAAEHMAAGDLSQRVPVSGEDELAHLGRAFNRMADSLEQAKASRRAMTADIAHELRNPLAVQRATLEAMQDEVYPLNRENLSPVLDQNLLLTRLVDDLRTLALADAGQLQLDCVSADLVELAQRNLERIRPQAEAQQVQLTFSNQCRDAAVAWVDPMRIEQIIQNLLSNALRYTPPGGQIYLDIIQHSIEPITLITVRDSGPGIPPDALPYVFERFYRVDRSRSRSEGGSGLGLAIARQLASAHHGSLEAANSTQGGAVFTLSLPVYRPGT